MARPWSGVSDAADQPRRRDPLLHARPRRAPDRGGPTGWACRRLIAPHFHPRAAPPRTTERTETVAFLRRNQEHCTSLSNALGQEFSQGIPIHAVPALIEVFSIRLWKPRVIEEDAGSRPVRRELEPGN